SALGRRNTLPCARQARAMRFSPPTSPFDAALPNTDSAPRRPNCSPARSAGDRGARTPCCTCGWPTLTQPTLHRPRRFVMRLRIGEWPSPLSRLLIVTDDQGALRALEFADHESRMLRLLRTHHGAFELEQSPAPASIKRALHAYFDGDFAALDSI